MEDTPPPIVSQIQFDVISLGLTHVELKFKNISLSKKKKKPMLGSKTLGPNVLEL